MTNCDCNCGCHASSMPTSRECPECGRLLRLTGDLQRVEMYLRCLSCSYQSAKLTVKELHELI